MITPVFRVEQNSDFLIITIRAPYTKIKDTEILYEEKTFLFASKPYFLRLFLPASVVADETGTADYDFDTGSFTIKVPKLNKNERFDNLEMLSELLKAPTSKNRPLNAKPLVEENNLKSRAEDAENIINEIKDDDLYAKQTVPTEFNSEKLICDEICEKFGYGFAWKRHDVLCQFIEEISDLFDLKEPENSLIDLRAQKCLEFDKTKFNIAYYLADLFDPEEGLTEALNFCLETSKYLEINDLDREQLKNLKICTFMFPDEINQKISYSLIDILGAYLYDLRVTEGEHCVESGWTLAKLAPSLTYLVRWDSPKMALTGLVRRILCYPLYRNWELAQKVLEDLKNVFKRERVTILKCLLDIRRIFNKSNGGECRYLYNQLFIDDLCLWVQSVDLEILKNLSFYLCENLHLLNKSLIELDLEFLETEANLGTLKLDENGRIPEELDSDDDPNPSI